MCLAMRIRNPVMSENMKSSSAAVFFVDILGFSSLTKGQVQGIKPEDYEAWGLTDSDCQNHSFLAASILLEFRDVLFSLKQYLPNLKVAQISDCAFIWCEDVGTLLRGVHYFMWTAMKEKGILCRGGLAYGEIVEVPNVDYELGAFVVGDAVTRAAKNEGRLKGPRITMDETFPQAVWETMDDNPAITFLSSDLYHDILNLVDMSEVDEYRWYLFDETFLSGSSSILLDFKGYVELTKQRLMLANVLKYHPRMGWNARNKEGKIHLEAGEFSLSQNKLLEVLHLFETRMVLEDNRTIRNMNKANQRVMKDRYFSKDEDDAWVLAASESN